MGRPKAYPEYKKALWEAFRTFGAAFMGSIILVVQSGVDLNDWRNVLPSILIGAFAAGLRAVVKWAREKYAYKQYDHWLYKFPG